MKKYKVGYTAGVFDLLHVGHLNLLERCKQMCDYLIALKCVDLGGRRIIKKKDDKMLALDRFQFDVLFSGDDWKGTERYKKTEEAFAKVGVAIEYFPYTQGISTSDIKLKL